jgi:hypothetical protein
VAEQKSANRAAMLRQLLHRIVDRFEWGRARARVMIEMLVGIVREGRSPAEMARRLLAEHLSPEQLRELDSKRGFTVTGGKTGVRYLIGQGCVSNVYVLDKHGHVIANMCFGPAAKQEGPFRQELPEGDVMLAQKIALEDPDLEPEALRVANIRPSRALPVYPELKTIVSAIRDRSLGSSL